MNGTSRNSWIKITFACLLLAGLPIFIWAVLTQRIELRKRAATAEPTEICWNRVISDKNTYKWPNSCKGNPRTDLACTQILIPLTTGEIAGYQTWASMGKPYIPGCSPAPSRTPTCRPRPPCLDAIPHCLIPETSDMCPPTSPTPVSCGSNGSACTVTICPPMPICPPGTACPQVMPACTHQPGVCQNNRCIPTYPTPSCTMPPACAYAKPPCAYAVQGISYCPIQPTPTPNQPCTTTANCPPGYICSATPPGGCPVTIINGIKRITECATVPQCWPVNSTPTPYPSTTMPTPTLACTHGTPTVSLAPNNQSGNPGNTLTYNATIRNNDTQGCPVSLFAISTQVDTNFTARLALTTINIPQGSTANIAFTVTSPIIDPFNDTRSVPVSFYATNTVSNLSSHANAGYTLVKPTPQPLKFLVRLAGVSGVEAKGATITVKLKLKDGTILPFDKPLVLDSIGNGVYSATANLTNPLPVGTSFRVLVKGEKHSQIDFCRESGQIEACNDTDYITPTSYTFDFTGRPLPPGDLNHDGKVNADDLKFITDLFKKSSTQLTPQNLKTADVDYSGTIDAYDLNLVLQTLETRYDEQ